MKGNGGTNGGDRTGPCLEAIALAGWRAGWPLRDIAAAIYGRERVDACWHGDGALRSRMRRPLAKARARAGAGPGSGAGAEHTVGIRLTARW